MKSKEKSKEEIEKITSKSIDILDNLNTIVIDVTEKMHDQRRKLKELILDINKY